MSIADATVGLSSYDPTVQTIRGIDRERWRRVRAQAAVREVSIGALVDVALKEWLDVHASASPNRYAELGRSTPEWRSVRRIVDEWANDPGNRLRSFIEVGSQTPLDDLTDRLFASGVARIGVAR